MVPNGESGNTWTLPENWKNYGLWKGKCYQIKLARILRRVLGDLRRLAATQTPVKNHQLELLWKTREEYTNNNNNNKFFRIVDFAVHRINLKESERKDKYLDLSRELKNLWNMKVTVIPIVIGALGTVIKGLIQGLEDLEIRERVEAIQNIALLRSARILRKVLEIWGDLLSLKLQWKTIS